MQVTLQNCSLGPLQDQGAGGWLCNSKRHPSSAARTSEACLCTKLDRLFNSVYKVLIVMEQIAMQAVAAEIASLSWIQYFCISTAPNFALQAWRAVDRAYYDKNFHGKPWFKVRPPPALMWSTTHAIFTIQPWCAVNSTQSFNQNAWISILRGSADLRSHFGPHTYLQFRDFDPCKMVANLMQLKFKVQSEVPLDIYSIWKLHVTAHSMLLIISVILILSLDVDPWTNAEEWTAEHETRDLRSHQVSHLSQLAFI